MFYHLILLNLHSSQLFRIDTLTSTKKWLIYKFNTKNNTYRQTTDYQSFKYSSIPLYIPPLLPSPLFPVIARNEASEIKKKKEREKSSNYRTSCVKASLSFKCEKCCFLFTGGRNYRLFNIRPRPWICKRKVPCPPHPSIISAERGRGPNYMEMKWKWGINTD